MGVGGWKPGSSYEENKKTSLMVSPSPSFSSYGFHRSRRRDYKLHLVQSRVLLIPYSQHEVSTAFLKKFYCYQLKSESSKPVLSFCRFFVVLCHTLTYNPLYAEITKFQCIYLVGYMHPKLYMGIFGVVMRSN